MLLCQLIRSPGTALREASPTHARPIREHTDACLEAFIKRQASQRVLYKGPGMYYEYNLLYSERCSSTTFPMLVDSIPPNTRQRVAKLAVENPP